MKLSTKNLSVVAVSLAASTSAMAADIVKMAPIDVTPVSEAFNMIIQPISLIGGAALTVWVAAKAWKIVSTVVKGV